MSQENVELTYQAYDAFNRRDLGALLALVDEDVEFVSGLVAIEGGYRGHDGIRRWWKNLLETFPDFTVEVLGVRDLGDVTIATVRNRAHGAGSDTPVEQGQWQVTQWRDEKVVWWAIYRTEAAALEAARLRV